MTKQTYRLTRRHGTYAAGVEIELSEAEAVALDNEAPGVLEGPITTEPAKAAPKVKPRAESDVDTVEANRRALFKESA